MTSGHAAVSARERAARPGRSGLLASGATDPGLQREVNEDRFYCDAESGLFMVIDGVGGQAAGGTAADEALTVLRDQLGRQAGPIPQRLRGAITNANNQIHRLASTRHEWKGMACVLTVAVVADGKVTFGHVGDTRLYKLHADCIEKLTHDHSPVGEREDANELSERQAMHHPRRNEVYRDVGSEPHHAADPDFVEIGETAVEPDSALLLCSDGLTDLVDSMSIARTVARHAGDPGTVVHELIRAANTAGGKDNVTVVYVEGERFRASEFGRSAIYTRSAIAARTTPSRSRRAAGVALVALLSMVAVIAAFGLSGWNIRDVLERLRAVPTSVPARVTVAPTQSIAAALLTAVPGSEILVEPGEYREQVILKSGVRLISRIPRAATIRLPATLPEGADAAAVIARNVADAALVGFKVSGDAATPLPIGLFIADSTVSIADVEVTGASRAGVEFAGAGTSTLMASSVHDNPGAALVIRNHGAPRVAHNALARNGLSEQTAAPVIVEAGASPTFVANVFTGLSAGSFQTLDAAALAALRRDNWFLPIVPARSDGARTTNRVAAGR